MLTNILALIDLEKTHQIDARIEQLSGQPKSFQGSRTATATQHGRSLTQDPSSNPHLYPSGKSTCIFNLQEPMEPLMTFKTSHNSSTSMCSSLIQLLRASASIERLQCGAKFDATQGQHRVQSQQQLS